MFAKYITNVLHLKKGFLFAKGADLDSSVTSASTKLQVLG